MTPTRAEFLAVMLPPALELATAYTQSEHDPALFIDTMRRVVGESLHTDDPSTATAQLLFGLSALCGILLDDLAENTATDRAAVLADVHRRYLTP
jgi:hypothetical protein